ncbi:MAG: hypothetical protein J07HN4v3_00438 [Halonotius sp. J07HN4]|jgi:hypothetical protein|nr:MAG: hypothetical protein J07HN4v3_00438 [Halonotius sp. J07HN4]
MAPETAIDADALNGLADADEEEAAAIVAAITAYLQEQEAAAAATAAASDETAESQRSWEFTGRLAGVGITANRPPASTPADDWTAADRADRF